jgi:hypothetical protein
MPLNLNDFIKLLKLPATYLLAISISTGLLLFSNERVVQQLGFKATLESFRPWIGGAFLLSTSLLIVGTLKTVVRALKNLLAMLHGCIRLHFLTRREQDILQFFVFGNTRTAYFEPYDGDVCNLVRLRILFSASDFVHQVMGLSYSIRGWAWWYLRRFPRLLGDSRIDQLKKRTY